MFSLKIRLEVYHKIQEAARSNKNKIVLEFEDVMNFLR